MQTSDSNWEVSGVSNSTDTGYIDYTIEAMQKFTDAPFAFNSFFSIFLAIVGVSAYIIATWKWYTLWDQYPGYQKRIRKEKNNVIRI